MIGQQIGAPPRRRGRSGALAAAALAVASSAPGCMLFPAPAESARRLGQDLFVVVTAPLQVPWVAARDAWAWTDSPDRSRAWVPLFFVGDLVLQSGLAALHAVDAAVAPLHFVAGNGPAGVYEGFALPHQPAATPLAPAAGEMLLWGAAGAGGAVVAWWFGGTYVPHLFRFFTG
ncbi:MAG: hypothetical protein JNL90_02495 [Planctomycetes bacterium]|nr:hypothetical protein [Planctomycetota bacterium]